STTRHPRPPRSASFERSRLWSPKRADAIRSTPSAARRSSRNEKKSFCPVRSWARITAMTDTKVRSTGPIAEPDLPAPASPRQRPIVPVIAAILVVLALGLLVRLSAQENGGPPHMGVSIGSGIPGTLYMPGKLDDGQFPRPK